jgi:hypothetical protein
MNWLEEIIEFSSYSEFESFENFLKTRLFEKELEEIEPQEYFHGQSPFGLNKDRWFRNCSNDDLWRLIPPDYPFKGFFKKVTYPLDNYKKE